MGLKELGWSTAEGIIGTGLGMATANWNDRRQLEQQRKLQELQMEGQYQMMQRQQNLALDMWHKTNYDAQVKELQKAGLNVGLMYKSAGEGGRLAQPTGSVTGGTAPSGGGELGMGLQLMMLKAQIENLNADTGKKKAEANITSGAHTELAMAQIANLGQQTANEKVKNATLHLQNRMTEIELDIQSQTADQLVQNVLNEGKILIETLKAKEYSNTKTAETLDAEIAMVNRGVEEQAIRISAMKLGIIKTGADINLVNQQIAKLYNDIQIDRTVIQQGWENLGLQERQTIVAEALRANADTLTEFNTNLPSRIGQWTGIIGNLISGTKDAVAIAGPGTATRPTVGFKR